MGKLDPTRWCRCRKPYSFVSQLGQLTKDETSKTVLLHLTSATKRTTTLAGKSEASLRCQSRGKPIPATESLGPPSGEVASK